MAGKKGSREIEAQVDRLLELAKGKAKEAPALAKKYVTMARALAMRHRVPLGRKRKLLFCRECGMPLIAGHNLKVRIRSKEKKIEYACACGKKKTAIY